MKKTAFGIGSHVHGPMLRAFLLILRYIIYLIKLIRETGQIFISKNCLLHIFMSYKEHHQGTRIASGSEPGPFIVKRHGAQNGDAFILEVVHPSQSEDHSATSFLGRLGGQFYLVLTPLNGGRKTVIVMWAVNIAGTDLPIDWIEMAHSAGQALHHHRTILNELRLRNMPNLHGFVMG